MMSFLPWLRVSEGISITQTIHISVDALASQILDQPRESQATIPPRQAQNKRAEQGWSLLLTHFGCSDRWREKQIYWDEAILDKIKFRQKAPSIEWKQHKDKIATKKGEFFWHQSHNYHLPVEEEGDSQLAEAAISCINKATAIYSSWEFVLQRIPLCAMWLIDMLAFSPWRLRF